MSLLEIKNLNFSYNEQRQIINDLSFNLDSGDVLAILGPNGSGKTTLLKLIMGMLQYSGEILLDGQDIKKISARDFWKKVSFVPQQRNVVNSLNVYDSIMIGRSCYIGAFSIPRDEDFFACDRVIDELGIKRLKNRYCDTLSGGELQLVLIARALVSNPKILILDEPESGLDFRNQLLILNVIEDLKQKKITSIFNTHYPKHALQKANKTIMLGDKNPIYGNTLDVITEKNIENIFGIKALINEIRVGNEIIKNVVPLYVVE